jgi:NADPH2:quinone reductase
VSVEAAGLNHLDLLLSRGELARKPVLPSVAGSDGVGTGDDGTRLYFDRFTSPYGALAERALVRSGGGFPVPDGLSSPVAAALGNAGLAAYLALAVTADLRPQETVMVLGATGVVGRLAVQIARLLGCGAVIGAGRNPRALEELRALGVDHAAQIGAESGPEVLDGCAPADVIVDLVGGETLQSALHQAAQQVRVVQVGHRGGRALTLDAAVLRSKQVHLRGHTNIRIPDDVRRRAYDQLATWAMEGRLRVDVRLYPLADIAAAWDQLEASAYTKLVVVPGQALPHARA